MAIKRIRIILDTNWYVSATINKNSRRTLYQILTNKKLIVLFCSELIDEYQRVINRDKFSKVIKPKQASRLMNIITPTLEYNKLTTPFELSRDVKDNYLLSLSIDGKADYLITGDDDLLILEQIGKTKIVRLNFFLNILSNS